MPWGFAAAAVAAAGTAYSADASRSASNTQADAAKNASGLQLGMFNTTKQNLSPWLQSGNTSLDQLMYLSGLSNKPGTQIASDPRTATLTGDNKAFRSDSNDYLGRFGYGDKGGGTLEEIAPTWGVDRVVDKNGNVKWGKPLDQQPGAADPMKGSLLKPFGMEDFQASPAYQFNLAEGEKAINKAAAARGKFYAPGTLQDISKFSQGLASNEFQNAYSNYNTNMGNIWSRLSTLSGGGQNAAANLGTNASSVSGQVGSNMMSGGAAQAAGQVGQANAVNSGLGSAYNNYLMQQILAGNQQSSVGGGSGGMTGANDLGGNYA